MAARVLERLALLCPLALLGLGVIGGWSFRVTLFSALASLVLGLAAARLVAFIAARKVAKPEAPSEPQT